MKLSFSQMRARALRNVRSKAGDTLIEVTLALAILSMVLITSTVVATQSYRLGQTARERTTISNAAQGQLEAMRAFRDNHSWAQFLSGGVTPAAYTGVLNTAVGTGCRVTSPCLHMEKLVSTTYVPRDGTMDGPFTTSYLEMVVTPGPGATPRSVIVIVNYGMQSLSGSTENTGHIQTTFTDLGYAAVPPPPPPPLPCTGSLTDIVLVLDTSGSMKDTSWSGTGVSRLEEMKTYAKAFIDAANIGLLTNHVAVVDFSDSPTTDYALGGDAVAAKAAVTGLNTNGGTMYVPALTMGGNIISGARPGVSKVIVFLSDGQARDDNATQAVQAEMAALPVGTKIFTIGIRADGEDMSLLYNVMPMNGGFFSDATDASKLQQIVINIAGAIACT
jgi:type II secretory pathway pseudopilin PulG